MHLKILNRPVRTAPGTINYCFRELLEALDLLGNEERTWVVSDARVTWPEELLDERMEVHDPRIRFLRDGHNFACTQDVLAQIAGGIEGDWTDVWVVEGAITVVDSVDLDNLDQRKLDWLDEQMGIDVGAPFTWHFYCIDAAFWVLDSLELSLVERLASHGFSTETYNSGAKVDGY